MQTRLLRVLEERKLRPVGSERERRWMYASSPPPTATSPPRSAPDASARTSTTGLAVVDIDLPPLRDRTEDIPELMRHFMQQFSVQLGVPPLPLSHEVVSRLAGYSWPGNVRELRNYIRAFADSGHFPPQPSAAPTATDRPADAGGRAEASLAEVERRHIERVTAACEGNKTEAARRLGVSRKTLERKFAEWALADAAAACGSGGPERGGGRGEQAAPDGGARCGAGR